MRDVAQGHSYRQKRRIVIDFDKETFVEVRRFAQLNGDSVAATVRLLIETGLEEHKAARFGRREVKA